MEHLDARGNIIKKGDHIIHAVEVWGCPELTFGVVREIFEDNLKVEKRGDRQQYEFAIENYATLANFRLYSGNWWVTSRVRKFSRVVVDSSIDPCVSESGVVCDYFFHGERRGISPALVDSQGIDQTTADSIIKLHRERATLIDLMKHTSETDIELIREMYKIWHKIEFDLQELWGFEKDINHHAFWRMPHCTCPVMDNEDPLMPGPIYSGGCIVHKNIVEEMSKFRGETWKSLD